ncbi:MAG: hypothetical protein LBH57_02000 [Treponema sp.]|jgi:hypothetical protein|nr:hypothetical protein [Treponema sp.]
MLLQKLIGNLYSLIVEILLWIVPIAAFTATGVLLSGQGSGFHLGYAFLGLAAGLVLDVIFFGPVIILFNMRASLKNLEPK